MLASSIRSREGAGPPALQLYHRWHCPYSKRVRDFIDQQKLSDRIEFIEIGEVKGAEAKLDELTAGRRCPAS